MKNWHLYYCNILLRVTAKIIVSFLLSCQCYQIPKFYSPIFFVKWKICCRKDVMPICYLLVCEFWCWWHVRILKWSIKERNMHAQCENWGILLSRLFLRFREINHHHHRFQGNFGLPKNRNVLWRVSMKNETFLSSKRYFVKSTQL